MRLPGFGSLAVGLIVVAVGGCGANSAPARGPGGGSGGGSGGGPSATPVTVRVTGQVARTCMGPLLAGRPRRCSDRAVLVRDGSRVTVTGRFSVRLRPGRYRVSVNNCMNQQTLYVKRAIVGLNLVPRCLQPL